MGKKKARFEMADGSYPINNCADVSDAAKLAHHSKTYSFDQVRRHVMRAKAALGCPDSVLPDTWASDSGSNSRPMGTIERRYFPLTSVQVETRAGGDPTIRGYAAVFNSLSQRLGFFKERIAPGAGARSVREDDIVSLWNHNPDYPLGRTGNRRLQLRLDDHGLHMAVKPSATTYAADLVANVRDGTVIHQSFSFTDARDKWSREDGVEVRTLLDYRILDVSPVTFAAYTATDVQVRSWVKEAGLDFEPLSAAMCRCFRGLELTPDDEELLEEAVNRVPALRSWSGVQARPRPRVLSRPQQAQWPDLKRRYADWRAKRGHPLNADESESATA